MRNRADLENGPHPSDLDPIEDEQVTTLHCYFCCPLQWCNHSWNDSPQVEIVKTRIGGGSDPTEVYDLACGHTVI